MASSVSKYSQSIAAMRSERHALWAKKDQLGKFARKWAPIILDAMNRKKNAASIIQRWLRRVLFAPIDNVVWKCPLDTPGIFRIRFCIGEDNVNIISFGLTEEQWKDTGMEIPYTLIISDLRDMSPNGLFEIDGITYTLNCMQLKRFRGAEKKISSLRYLQDIEYMKSLVHDRKNGLIS